jgi:hypothetical protein
MPRGAECPAVLLDHHTLPRGAVSLQLELNSSICDRRGCRWRASWGCCDSGLAHLALLKRLREGNDAPCCCYLASFEWLPQHRQLC